MREIPHCASDRGVWALYLGLGPLPPRRGPEHHPKGRSQCWAARVATSKPQYMHSGQLDWQTIGTARAAACGAHPAMVVNTWPVDGLLAWTDARGGASGE
jgi:hypothetical protein